MTTKYNLPIMATIATLLLTGVILAGCIDTSKYIVFNHNQANPYNETGKAAGEMCQSGSECYSQNCNYTTFTCEEQPLTGSGDGQVNEAPLPAEAQPPASGQRLACDPAGALCISGSSCCSQNCNYTTYKCEEHPLNWKPATNAGEKMACSQAGAYCQSGATCCSLNCNYTTNVCEANPLSTTPQGNAQTASQTQCKTEGQTCQSGGECCSQNCNYDTHLCQPPVQVPACYENGAYCTSNTACCSNICNFNTNQCVTNQISQTPFAGCKAEGETCQSGGECCSYECNYSATPNVCAPRVNICFDEGTEISQSHSSTDTYNGGDSQGTYNGVRAIYNDICKNGVNTEYSCQAAGQNDAVIMSTTTCPNGCNDQGSACKLG